MLTILGIDPGSRITGYGLIWVKGSEQGCVTYGHIQTQAEQMSDRLYEIYSRLSQIIQEHCPTEAAIEQVYMHQNVQSALKLGQARGALFIALASQQLPVSEYSPREIKQAVVGYGASSKEQVQQMVTTLLKLKKGIQADAADALAVALCHANSRLLKERLKNAKLSAGEGS